jgi:hypothetical protein
VQEEEEEGTKNSRMINHPFLQIIVDWLDRSLLVLGMPKGTAACIGLSGR